MYIPGSYLCEWSSTTSQLPSQLARQSSQRPPCTRPGTPSQKSVPAGSYATVPGYRATAAGEESARVTRTGMRPCHAEHAAEVSKRRCLECDLTTAAEGSRRCSCKGSVQPANHGTATGMSQAHDRPLMLRGARLRSSTAKSGPPRMTLSVSIISQRTVRKCISEPAGIRYGRPSRTLG